MEESPRPQPVVTLLGPVGSGKSHTLRLISEDCGRAIVHALLDFDQDKPADGATDEPADAMQNKPASTAEALVLIADQMNRKWPARRAIRFTRFTLCLISALAKLGYGSPDRDKAALRSLISELSRHPETERALAGIPLLSATAEPPDAEGRALADALRKALPRLIRSIDRLPLRDARRWHLDIPQAEDATPLDTLLTVNEEATSDPGAMTAWLTAAFLADVRDNHPRMAAPDPGSPCVCDDRDHRRHWHNWILLLDNIDDDHKIGDQFLHDLRIARDRHLARKPEDHDALVVIAASGRWNDDWGADWRPPWVPEPATPDRARTVVGCRDASYQHWRGEANPEVPQPPDYPVLLEPLNFDETARILDVGELSEQRVFAQRATGGLPAAVKTLETLLRGTELKAGARDVLARPDHPAGPEGEDLWLARLSALRLNRHLPDIYVRDFVTATPYATAPWLTPADAEAFLPRRHVGRILTELRSGLWVIAPRGARGTSDRTELHPWVARLLISALAARPDDGYAREFESLLNDVAPPRPAPADGEASARSGQFDVVAPDPEDTQGQARQMYCHLAADNFTVVVDFFTKTFDQEPHQDWIDRLELVTSAPDHEPLHKDQATVYSELVNHRNSNLTEEQSPVGNIVCRLVAALWVATNPFAVPDPNQQGVIRDAYRDLVRLSRRPDVAALHAAARRAGESYL